MIALKPKKEIIGYAVRCYLDGKPVPRRAAPYRKLHVSGDVMKTADSHEPVLMSRDEARALAKAFEFRRVVRIVRRVK